MKILVLLFLVGCAAASVHETLDETAELLYHDLMFELEDDGHFYNAEDDDVRTELGKKLRETLNELIERIKERIEKGKGLRQEFIDKIKELRDKMKEKGIDLGEKAKEALKKIRERISNFLDDLLENLKTKNRRHVDDYEIIEALADSGLKELFRKLKKIILDKIDKEALKTRIEELFGKGNEMADSLLEMLNKKGDKYKEKLLDLIDRYLGKKEEVEKRSMKEMWEKVKNYFKDLQIDLKEKYMKFGEWIREVGGKYLEKGKDKMENIRNIAREFIDHTKGVSKDVAVEALEFLKPYKEDLGALWDQVKDTVKDIVNRKE